MSMRRWVARLLAGLAAFCVNGAPVATVTPAAPVAPHPARTLRSMAC